MHEVGGFLALLEMNFSLDIIINKFLLIMPLPTSYFVVAGIENNANYCQFSVDCCQPIVYPTHNLL